MFVLVSVQTARALTLAETTRVPELTRGCTALIAVRRSITRC
jgi:hypothetical protein